MMTSSENFYIGLMSGTSLDGVDGVIVAIPNGVTTAQAMRLVASAYVPFDAALRQQALDLQQQGDNEIHREALLANAIAHCYAECVSALQQQQPGLKIVAVGAHGQTIRHQPEAGYTRQTINAALLAELTGIDVVADFRSRDVAAGGQGAPLVPAFHRALFASADECRVVVNIGGISNISILQRNGATLGFDTGPGNVLMDAWIAQQQGKRYDANGDWAAQGSVNPALLVALMQEPYLSMPAPKSTGRDLFNPAWLFHQLKPFGHLPAVDVQATLTRYTAMTLAAAIVRYAPEVGAVFVCGGGANNAVLMQALAQELDQNNCHCSVQSTEVLGISPNHVEALAFAWLAQRFQQRLPGNLPAVTGARGLRLLGALYPA